MQLPTDKPRYSGDWPGVGWPYALDDWVERTWPQVADPIVGALPPTGAGRWRRGHWIPRNLLSAEAEDEGEAEDEAEDEGEAPQVPFGRAAAQ